MASLLLRAGLAFSLLYPAIAGFLNPVAWVGYVPSFVEGAGVSRLLFLQAFEVFEIALALWLLSGWKVAYSASITAITFLAITFFNWHQIDVLFRDISLVAASLALVLLKK